MRPRTGAILLAGLVGSTSACAFEKDRALDHAITNVHQTVESGRSGIASGARDRTNGEIIAAAATSSSLVFDSRPADGGVELDMAFHDRGEAGGGGTYVDVHVRTCVRIWVHGGREAAAEVTTALECPPTLPAELPGHGVIDTTVEYDPGKAPR